MSKFFSLFLGVLMIALAFGSAAAEAPEVILVISFGTSYNDTRAVTIDAIENTIQEAFPDSEVRRAFTSQIIIDKLADRDNLVIDTVTQAMERLVADGVKTLVVQPTHVINGYEYDDLAAEVYAFADQFDSIKMGAPLLSSTEDYLKIIDIIKAEYPLENDEALVLMGHGTHHFANAAYAALDYMFKAGGSPNIFIGTVEGYPELDIVLPAVQALNPTTVYLAPLMVVAGDHANNDLAGDEADSWKTIFKAAGLRTEPVLRGMGEFKGVQQLYIEHIKAVISEN